LRQRDVGRLAVRLKRVWGGAASVSVS